MGLILINRHLQGVPKQSIAQQHQLIPLAALLFSHVVKLQVMSICETQYRGENIIIVAPDSDVLSVLQVGGHTMLPAMPCQVHSKRPC